MKQKLLILSLVLIGMMTLTAMNTAAWIKLGERKINYSADRDEIVVTAGKGTFTALKFKVKNSPITMRKMIVHYSNGSKHDVAIRFNIPAGGESRVIDLPGGNRNIRKVVFWYDTKNAARGRANLALWGRK